MVLVSEKSMRVKAYDEIKKHRRQVEADKNRSHFHLMPPVGLLNDPNGLIQYQGVYHIFYQWNPFATAHGMKYWGHYSTKDFVNWTVEPIALSPDEWYDKNGCYSGSAIEFAGKMYLFYTGNVKKVDGSRESYQCLAVSEDGCQFEKIGPILDVPAGYTAHFRDPKVWQHTDQLWYMVLGAQTNEEQGQVVLYRSSDLHKWEFLGPIAGNGLGGLEEFGYMWECPDLFSIGEKDVLLVSPQGLKAEGMQFQNAFQSGYFVGKWHAQTNHFEHDAFIELDRGFDFYAPQTMLDEQGRRIMFAWMGMSDEFQVHQPSIQNQWLHMLTMPRELILKNGKIYQSPLSELTHLRQKKQIDRVCEPPEQCWRFQLEEGSASEWKIKFEGALKGGFMLEICREIQLSYNSTEKQFTVERTNFKRDRRERRHCRLESLQQLHIYVDTSAIEIFINEGEETFTARYYAESEGVPIELQVSQTSRMFVEMWLLTPFTFQHSEKTMD